MLQSAYRCSFYGRPGCTFVDLPADLIQSAEAEDESPQVMTRVATPPKAGAPDEKILDVVRLIMSAKAPLVVVGKGAAHAQAEAAIRDLVER